VIELKLFAESVECLSIEGRDNASAARSGFQMTRNRDNLRNENFERRHVSILQMHISANRLIAITIARGPNVIYIPENFFEI